MPTPENQKKIEYLSRYRKLGKRIEQLSTERAMWLSRACKTTQTISDMPKAKNGAQGDSGEVAQYIEIGEEITQELRNLHRLRRKIRDAIRKYENDLETFGVLASYQAETTANKEGGRKALVYRLNEQQAAFLLTLLKNTPVVVAFKKELVRQFYAMRSLLFEKTTPLWQDTRQMGKEIRQRETSTLLSAVPVPPAGLLVYGRRDGLSVLLWRLPALQVHRILVFHVLPSPPFPDGLRWEESWL